MEVSYELLSQHFDLLFDKATNQVLTDELLCEQNSPMHLYPIQMKEKSKSQFKKSKYQVVKVVILSSKKSIVEQPKKQSKYLSRLCSPLCEVSLCSSLMSFARSSSKKRHSFYSSKKRHGMMQEALHHSRVFLSFISRLQINQILLEDISKMRYFSNFHYKYLYPTSYMPNKNRSFSLLHSVLEVYHIL